MFMFSLNRQEFYYVPKVLCLFVSFIFNYVCENKRDHFMSDGRKYLAVLMFMPCTTLWSGAQSDKSVSIATQY